MMTRILAKGYLWFLLALLYSPILIIMIFSFTEAKVLGNWTGFSTKLYSIYRRHAPLTDECHLEHIRDCYDCCHSLYPAGKPGSYRHL